MNWSDITDRLAIQQVRMNWCKALVLFLFLLFNLVIVCIAALLVYVSVHYYISLHGYTNLLQDTAKNVTFLVLPLVIMVVVSLLLLLIALVGFIAGVCQVRFMYALYIVMFVALLALQITGAVLIGVFEGPIKNSISEGMVDNIHLYNDTSSIKEVFDNIQEDMKCCGINNYTDWGDNELKVPESCCKDGTECDTCVVDNINTVGCLSLLFREAYSDGVVTLTIIVLFGVFQISGIVLALLLICCRDEKAKTYQNLKDGLPNY